MADYTRVAYSLIFVFLAVCTFKELTVQTTSEKQIPVTKVGLNTNLGPKLKFLYCYSCGYQRAYEDYANMIRQKYPQITVTGGNYDPPGINLYIAKGVAMLKMVVIICIASGTNIFTKLGLQSPSWWSWCIDNKIYSCLLIFFLSNAIEGHCISTGAFEIFFNDMPVWSKLDTGRIPQPSELFQILGTHMDLQDASFDKAAFPK